MRHHAASSFGDFTCTHCHVLVPSAHVISGVNNRNHCPYCLWSRHLDLFAAGDRLSACKAPMKPVGLTMKPGRNKYRREARGELLLIHQCTGCRALSINRIAADDDSSAILAVFEESLESEIHRLCEQQGILVLRASDSDGLRRQLYGSRVQVPVPAWS
jgi:hypothetical protein